MHAADSAKRSAPSVVVVDPRFDAYKPLAASARLGRIDLHFRSSGTAAVRLARQIPVDAWLIATDLDDMSGHDLVALLRAEFATRGKSAGVHKVAVVDPAAPSSGTWSLVQQEGIASGADAVLTQPITFQDLEVLLGLPMEERAKYVAPASGFRGYAAIPVGVGAAVIAIAVMMLG
ncbi:MAG: hypothetical protein ACKOC4_07800 [Planctomycetia bacterium]